MTRINSPTLNKLRKEFDLIWVDLWISQNHQDYRTMPFFCELEGRDQKRTFYQVHQCYSCQCFVANGGKCDMRKEKGILLDGMEAGDPIDVSLLAENRPMRRY